MLTQHPSRIFKWDFRPQFETEKYRRISVFKPNESFGTLLDFDDETLAPKYQHEYVNNDDLIVVLIPLVGAIEVAFEQTSLFISINQIFAFKAKKGISYTVTNPYDVELVNFLQLKISSELLTEVRNDFNLDNKNQLFSIFETENFIISIGVFDARKEEEYHLQLKSKGVFTYVINGAFEFQNRLLEGRDALSIWEIETIEMESLTENSILLIIENY